MLDHVMDQLHATFTTIMTDYQTLKLSMQKEDVERTLAELFLFMVAVSKALGDAYSLVLDRVYHKSADLTNTCAGGSKLRE